MSRNGGLWPCLVTALRTFDHLPKPREGLVDELGALLFAGGARAHGDQDGEGARIGAEPGRASSASV